MTTHDGRDHYRYTKKINETAKVRTIHGTSRTTHPTTQISRDQPSHLTKMAETTGAAKKGKKTAAPDAPRFGRVRSNLKVTNVTCPVWVQGSRLINSFGSDGCSGFAKRWQVKYV